MLNLGINKYNPFQNAYNAGMSSTNASVANTKSVSLFGNNNHNNEKFNPDLLNKDTSIFSQFKVNTATGVNPFAGVTTTPATEGIAPVHARQNYQNGLAPADNLQNVFAGQYNGKANFLNQIAIA